MNTLVPVKKVSLSCYNCRKEDMHKSVLFLIGLAALAFTSVLSEDVEDTGLVIDGIDVTKLSYAELQTFSTVLDEKLAGELDLHVFKSSLAEKTGRRKKRFIFSALALFVGKMLFKSYVVGKVATLGKVGATVAKVYTVYDTVDTAKDVYDTFNSLRPDNVTTSVVDSGDSRGERIMTGEIADIKVTARSSGPSGVPTLELNGEKVVREFQFSRKRH